YGAAGAYLVRLNATGNVQWTRTVDFDSGWSVLQSRDGGFLLVGTAYGWYDFGLVAKLDGSGNLQWGRFTNSGLDAFIKKSAIQTPDGGFLVAGVVMYQNIDLPDLSLIKLSSTGQMQWSRGFYYRYASGYEETNALISTRDSGYMIVGWTDSYGVVGGKDVLVVKLDSLGHLQWARTVGGTLDDVGEAVVQTDDGGYAVAGWTQSFGAGSTDVYIFKLDSLGNLQWTRTAGGTGNDVGYDIVQTRTGDLVVVGYTTSYGAGNRDMFLVKLDASGNVCAGCGGSPGGEVRSPNIIEYPIGAVDTLIPSLSGGFTTDSGGVAGRICGALDVEEHPGGDFAENISVSCVFRRAIQIRVAKALPDPMHVVLRDMAGRVVYDRTFPSTRTRVLQDENLRRLRPGVYGLTLVSGGRKSHRRLVKLEE
ncbi:MAG: T9SS type A sorting domain-containing protein, partial [Candidatus Hydrothermae bacterium]|nr:T9SS type A sorting domain-containing protein [Candidatus Hydrothermae bacterium]